MSSPVFTTAVTVGGSTTSTTPASRRAAPTPPARKVSTTGSLCRRRYAHVRHGRPPFGDPLARRLGGRRRGGVRRAERLRAEAGRSRGRRRAHLPLGLGDQALQHVGSAVAVEEGSVSLEEPAGPPGSTVAHLLAHASGLGPAPTAAVTPGQRRAYIRTTATRCWPTTWRRGPVWPSRTTCARASSRPSACTACASTPPDRRLPVSRGRSATW